jgi:4,5-DOPA dioxygenase extradiol
MSMDRRTFLGALGAAGVAAVGPSSWSRAEDGRTVGPLMPAFFIGHGSPLNAVEDNRFTLGWKEAMKDIPPPEAILCISAHWMTSGTFVTATSRLWTVHDHGIASRKLNAVRYDAPGNPELAYEIASAVRTTSVGLDDRRGLDRGTWPILRHVFPGADVPVLQLSIDARMPGIGHYKLGRELRHLRRRGVLVIGSGNIVHNPREADLALACDGFEWAVEASGIIKAKILAGDHRALCEHETLGPAVRLAVPTTDHYDPLLYVLGMQTSKDKLAVFNDAMPYDGVTMTSVRVGV